MQVLGRARALLFPAGAGLLIGLHAVLVVRGLVDIRLWEDEAYNLSVPLNLLHGFGYTSDGILTGGERDPFDVRISTGPVVLMPVAAMLATGIDTVVGARAVMGAFYAALLAGLFLVGRRLGGRWGGLIAAMIPLVFDGRELPSPIQGPTDVLGEIPAAAALVAAALLVGRKPALAGLAVGLAIQCKTLSVLALPALVMVILLQPGEPRDRIRKAIVSAIFASLPTLVFEMIKLVVLTPAGYLASTRELLRFLASGGQSGFSVQPATKLEVLAGSWYLPAPLGLGLGLVLVILFAVAVAVALRRRRLPGGDRAWFAATDEASMVLFAAGVAVVWLTWWFASDGQPAWVRHPAPALLMAVPIVLVTAVSSVARSSPGLRLAPAARAAISLAVIACLAVQVIGAMTTRSGGETLAEQRRVASEIRKLPGDLLFGKWGALPPLALLADKRAVLVEDAYPTGPVLLETWNRDPSAVSALRDLVDRYCERPLLADGDYLVCSPRAPQPQTSME